MEGVKEGVGVGDNAAAYEGGGGAARCERVGTGGGGGVESSEMEGVA